MSRFATKLHVPSKDPVFKHKQHRELDHCIEAWLAARYGKELAVCAPRAPPPALFSTHT